MKIAIVNYQSGNLASIQKKLRLLGVDFFVAQQPEDLAEADKLILPGVGHFGVAMHHLTENNWIEPLYKKCIQDEIPTLGICLGMQLMLSFSEEGNSKGLDWVRGKVVRFTPKDTLNYKIPHIGWNSVSFEQEHAINSNLPENASFYFVHSYHAQLESSAEILHRTEYCYSFTSALLRKNIIGVQYHPEKSHDVGLQLIKNFITL